jgi:hypothetical protein
MRLARNAVDIGVLSAFFSSASSKPSDTTGGDTKPVKGGFVFV